MSATTPALPLLIMPFGDSITQWGCRLDGYTFANDTAAPPYSTEPTWISSPGGYRYYLGNTLSQKKVPFAYVGSEFDCGSHEGHSGWTIEQLAEITEASMSAHRPDVALFMAGTNDFFNAPPVGANATGAAARLRRLLDTAFHVLPKLTFLISTVTTIDATRCKDYPKAPWHPPPCPAAMPAMIDAFNAMLPAIVAEYASRGFDIALHDVNAAAQWTPEDRWIWGIHFNATGFEKMAAAWDAALAPVVARRRPAPPTALPAGKWRLVDDFSDEFDGATVNLSKWNTSYRSWGSWTWDPANVAVVAPGMLKISMAYEAHTCTSGATCFYKSGIARSRKPEGIAFGYFEARIKGASRWPGVCPAFWAWRHADDYWTELDFVEMLENKVTPRDIDFTSHLFPPSVPAHVSNSTHRNFSWDPRDDFHTYGMEWNSSSLTWWVDGTVVKTEPAGIFAKGHPMDVALSFGLRPPLRDAPNATGFPTSFLVDYVRVYQREEEEAPIEDLCGASGDSASGCAPNDANVPMPLYLVPKAKADARGAVCLDGTPPGYYFSSAQAPSKSTSWVLYFKGGGWCYDEDECAGRAKTDIGSSDLFAPNFSFSGIMDSTAAVNPTFSSFNRAILWYCDGASFSGDRTAPYHHKPTNQTLYFRGRRVLELLIDELIERRGLGDATDVLVSGGSAGGLATFLHADRVAELLRDRGVPIRRLKAVPVSGFFLMHDDRSGAPTWPDQMKHVASMQNATGGLNRACVAAQPSTEAWRCIFANYSYAYSATPMFPLQSTFDSWQLGNIWRADEDCGASNFANCTRAAVDRLNAYRASMLADMGVGYFARGKSQRPGEGGFVETCYEHVAAQGAHFDRYALRGVVERDAVGRWWDAPATAPASEHWYLPCKLSEAAPHQCMPTCGA